jgi:predicted regulator of Ras-like GTPase activity (Roadblock/LC7/MglB family)
VGGEKLSQSADITRAETTLTNVAAITTSDGEDPAFASLGASLAEIRKLKGVLGYIMRGNTSAIMDLTESDKISKYALLSYQLHDSSLEIAKLLNVSEIESALAEGKNLKVLLIKIGENKISVFMEKSANHSGIIKRVLI